MNYEELDANEQDVHITPLEQLNFYADQQETTTLIADKLARQKLAELGYTPPKDEHILVPANFYRQERAFTKEGKIVFNAGHAQKLISEELVAGHQIMFVRGEDYNPDKITTSEISVFIVGDIEDFIQNCQNDPEKLLVLFNMMVQEFGQIITKINTNQQMLDGGYITDKKDLKKIQRLQETNTDRLKNFLDLINTFLEKTKITLKATTDQEKLQGIHQTLSNLIQKQNTLK